MESGQTCAKCGHAIPEGAPLSLCPHCLLGLASSLPPDFPEALGPVDTFDDYELLGTLGRGAMAVVYKAHQRSLSRMVALKMLRPYDAADSVLATRLRIEAEATANLHHPNIVTVYAVGEHEGQPFIAMEFVDGLPVNRFITAEGFRCELVRLTAKEKRNGTQATIARIMAKLAWAVDHSHKQGILHRDIKPSNVLIDNRGEPRLTDFGLAKILSGELVSGSKPGAFLGSPPYMSPEQASGKPTSTASDIYSLGATLYEMLTGRPPFKAATVAETVQQLIKEPPQNPSLLNKSVDPDLATVCLKCLEKDPRARYSSAQALAEELERWLRGEPIEARPSRLHERIWRWSRQEPKLAVLSIGLLLLLGAVAILSLTLYQTEKERLQAANIERDYWVAQLKPQLTQKWRDDGLVQLDARQRSRVMNEQKEFPQKFCELMAGIAAPRPDADPFNLLPKHIPFFSVLQESRHRPSDEFVFGLNLYKTEEAAIMSLKDNPLHFVRLTTVRWILLTEQQTNPGLVALAQEIPSTPGVIFVCTNSGITTVEELKGKNLLLGNKESCLGHVWPKAVLVEKGLRINDFKLITNTFNANVISFVNRSSTFLADDFKQHVSVFAEKLSKASDKVSEYIALRLDKEAREELGTNQSTRKLSLRTPHVLARNLNTIVNGPSIWDPVMFAGVELRPETIELRGLNPTGAEARRLNRLLLEDAYPEELQRREHYDAGVAEKADVKAFGPQFRIIVEFDYPGYVWLATPKLVTNQPLFQAVKQRLLDARKDAGIKTFDSSEFQDLRERLRRAGSFDSPEQGTSKAGSSPQGSANN